MQMENVIRLETSLDHLTGEELGAALCILNGMPQVLDAIYLHGTGKKNRPAGVLQVLCRPDDEAMVVGAIFRHTHTLGVRRMEICRYVLPRKATSCLVDGEEIPAKEYELEKMSYVRPEADALAALAKKHDTGMPATRLSGDKGRK